MTSAAAQQAIIAQFDLALAAYPTTKPKVQYPNRNGVDLATQVEPYIGLDIVNITGQQLDLNPKPMSVQAGQIVITAFCKDSSGWLGAANLLDYFLPSFELKNLSAGVRTHSAVYAKSNSAKGWEGYPLVVPFWWTRIAT